MHSLEEGAGRPLGVGNVLDLSMGAGFTGVILCENSRAAELRFMLFPTYVLCSIKKKEAKLLKSKRKACHYIPLHPTCTSPRFPVSLAERRMASRDSLTH